MGMDFKPFGREDAKPKATALAFTGLGFPGFGLEV